MLENAFNPCDWGFINTEFGYRIRFESHVFDLEKAGYAEDFWTLLRSTWRPEHDVYLSDESLGLDEITDNQSFYEDLNSLRGTEFDVLKGHLESVLRKNTIDAILQDLDDEAGR